MYKVFIDGKEGTTGLKIYDRLQKRNDISLLTLSEEDRKDPSCRKEMLNNCDIAFLCLPDAAAKESVSLVDNKNVKIIDTSTAHRTDKGWTYGFPEITQEKAEQIKNSKRVAAPGCHASGFIALVSPLINNGIISADLNITCHSVTGYSGGGKKMIAEYEDKNRDNQLSSPRQYGLTQEHKHLKEMQIISGLKNPPIFCPILADYYCGMVVTIPLFKNDLHNGKTRNDIIDLYKNLYKGPIVKFDNISQNGFIASNTLAEKDYMQITVEGNDDRILLIAQFDNLGKGASGAAVQCMNIMLGMEQTTGLEF